MNYCRKQHISFYWLLIDFMRITIVKYSFQHQHQYQVTRMEKCRQNERTKYINTKSYAVHCNMTSKTSLLKRIKSLLLYFKWVKRELNRKTEVKTKCQAKVLKPIFELAIEFHEFLVCFLFVLKLFIRQNHQFFLHFS